MLLKELTQSVLRLLAWKDTRGKEDGAKSVVCSRERNAGGSRD